MTDAMARGSAEPTTPKTMRDPVSSLIRMLVLLLVAGLVLVPLYPTVFGGLKTPGELRVNPFGLPEQWLWGNYWSMLTGSKLWHIMGNSLSVGILTVVLTLAV